MIHIDGTWFKDEHGRTLILRGVNLGGSSKVPRVPDGATHISEGFFDHRDVSFVGRPFPLEQADEHFSRLRQWGLTFLRFLVTWEAIEHSGPGQYDQAYLDYLCAVVEKAPEHGISLFIDPHQDVWSRFCGGDGAPGWTLEAVGLDIRKLHTTGAAFLHQVHGDPLPRMVWPTNGSKLAAATMFTLFFAGNDFAPESTVDGEPVQDYLQRHYLAAIAQVAQRLKGQSHVVGYDTLNEPMPGYIGLADLQAPANLLRLGPMPTPFQSMLLGSGIPQEVDVWDMGLGGSKRVGREVLNPTGANAWLPGYECVWRKNGVWDVDRQGTPRLLRANHFSQVNGQPVDFAQRYYRPFANRYAAAIRAVDPGASIFLESEPEHPLLDWGPDDAQNVVYAPHWYDGFVLFTKRFTPFLAVDMFTGRLLFGRRSIRRGFADQLAGLKRQAATRMGGVPTLIGEFGIAFDLAKKKAYLSGDFRSQVMAMDRSFRAMEDKLLSCTLWNYTADNTNAYGDQWNDEDLSIFSRDQQGKAGDIHAGGRALEAVVRPYARKVAGEPLQMSFDVRQRLFLLEFRHDPAVTAPTEIFVPSYQYPDGYTVDVSDGASEVGREAQILEYRHSLEVERHRICVRPK